MNPSSQRAPQSGKSVSVAVFALLYFFLPLLCAAAMPEKSQALTDAAPGKACHSHEKQESGKPCDEGGCCISRAVLQSQEKPELKSDSQTWIKSRAPLPEPQIRLEKPNLSSKRLAPQTALLSTGSPRAPPQIDPHR